MPESGVRTAFEEYALGNRAPVFAFEVPPGGCPPLRTLRYRQRLGLAAGLVYGIATGWEPQVWTTPDPCEVEVRWPAPPAPAMELFRVTATAP